MERQRILIAEDDAPMRARLEDALAADPALEVAFSTGTLAEALAGLRRLVPDVLLVDLGLPDGSGLRLIREARQLMADAQILVVTVFGDEKSVIAAIEAGARGYLLKDSEPSDVCQAVRQLLTGGAPISPAIARHLLRRFQEPARPPDAASATRPGGAAGELPHLSKREVEVLELVVKGFTFPEIGSLLGITPHTVTTHVRRIYRKLEVRSRSEAAYEAVQLGLVDV